MKKNLPTRFSLTRFGKNFLSFAFLLAGITAVAQPANQYTFSQNAGSYSPLGNPTVLASATASSLTATDDANYTLALPFNFNFDNVTYNSGTNIRVNTNGYLTFGTTASAGSNYTPISATTAYAGAVSALGADLSGSDVAANLGELSYETIGSAPNRTLVVQYKNYIRYVSNYIRADVLQFQIHLHETSNVIDFVYGTFATATTASTAQVGLRGATNAIYVNRTSTTNWAATTAGTIASATVNVSGTIKPADGLTFTFTPPGPCTAPPTAGTAVASILAGCPSVTTTTLSLTGSQTGTGVTYQWQESATGMPGSFSDVSGTGTNATYTATAITSTKYFRALVTCSGQTAESSVVEVVVNAVAVPYATLPYTQGFESWISRCNNFEVPGENWRATPASGNASWRRNDQGFTTAAWSYPANEPAPYPVASSVGSHSARFHTFGLTTGTGSLDLFVDLSAPGTKTLTFDYVNPSGTDKLDILLSTDGGTTWQPTPVGTYTTSAGFSSKSVTFTATSATSVLRFRGTTDYEADDLGIDNLRLEVTPSCPGVGFNPTTAITSTSATVNFAGNSSATSYTFNYSPGGTAQTLTNDAPVNLSSLSPYTLYTVTVTTNCAGGETATATTTFRTAIGNDNCENAVMLTPSATENAITYTTSGATMSTGLISPCTTALAGDVWFSFEATQENHSITVLPTFDFNAVIDLREGSCTGTNIACKNDFTEGGTAGKEILNATGLTIGNIYLIRVYSATASPSSGNFDIAVIEQAPGGTGSFTKDTMVYFPNPVSDVLNINAATSISEITIYNLLGQKMLGKRGTGNEEVVNVSSLSAGTYMVNVQSENGMKQFKIVKN